MRLCVLSAIRPPWRDDTSAAGRRPGRKENSWVSHFTSGRRNDARAGKNPFLPRPACLLSRHVLWSAALCRRFVFACLSRGNPGNQGNQEKKESGGKAPHSKKGKPTRRATGETMR